MFDRSEEFLDAVRWFVNKNASEKAAIIEDPGTLEDETEQEKFFKIVGEIRKALAKFPKEDVVQELEKLGLGAFALALVEKILNVVPPLEYSVKILNGLSRDTFSLCNKEYIENCLLGDYNHGRKGIIEKTDEDTFNSIENLYWNTLNNYLSGNINSNQLSEFLKKVGLSSDFVALVLNTIKEYEIELLRKLMYYHITSIKETIQRLEDQNIEIINILRELLKMLKSYSSAPSELYG